MGDSILYIALCTSILGLAILTIASESLEPPQSRIEDINTGSIGKNVHLVEKVAEVHKFKGGSILLKLSSDNASLEVFLPYDISDKFSFKPNSSQLIDVIGTVEIYNGRLEVSVDRESNLKLIENES